MLGDCFYWLFNMSITASFMGLLILIIRGIRRIPRRISIFLWIVPFIRMCVPYGLNSPYSLMAFISHFTTKTITVYQPTDTIAFSLTNSIMAANSYFPITYKVNILEKVFELSSLIWIVIFLSIILMLGILYASALYEIKDARPLSKNIYLSDKVQGPAVYGIIKPKVILPSSYKNKDIQYILKHEITHIHRADNLWRLLAFLTVAIHWFNPISWVFLKQFLSDIELACDETAIAKYDNEERKIYAKTLLECATTPDLFVSSFGGAKIRKRIHHILSYRRITGFSIASFTILIIAIISVSITNAG